MKTEPLDRLQLSALRHTAILALRTAFPKMPATQIAQALGIDHATVCYHLSAKYKGFASALYQPWSAELTAACRAIGSGNPSAAIVPLQTLLQKLAA